MGHFSSDASIVPAPSAIQGNVSRLRSNVTAVKESPWDRGHHHHTIGWLNLPSIISWQRKKNRRNWEFLEKSQPEIIPHSRSSQADCQNLPKYRGSEKSASETIHLKGVLRVPCKGDDKLSAADSPSYEDSGLPGSFGAAIPFHGRLPGRLGRVICIVLFF